MDDPDKVQEKKMNLNDRPSVVGPIPANLHQKSERKDVTVIYVGLFDSMHARRTRAATRRVRADP